MNTNGTVELLTVSDLTLSETKALSQMVDRRKPTITKENGYLCVSYGRPDTHRHVHFIHDGSIWAEYDSPYGRDLRSGRYF